MPTCVSVAIHPSQFPARVHAQLLHCLRSRSLNPKFHYDSLKQTRQWLALHQAHSPSRADPDCARAYDTAFGSVARRLTAARVHVVGLGCGGGQKDARFLKELRAAGCDVSYTPCDVSTPLVLAAREAALGVITPDACFPLVCDLAETSDLPAILDAQPGPAPVRALTFFGMIPNFEPGIIMPRLTRALRPADCLLFSANLAPGNDYRRGVESILPQYDNALTREWLMTFLLDLGVERGDGSLEFGLEPDAEGAGLLRVTATFRFQRDREVGVDAEAFFFRAGEAFLLFFSYRYTPELTKRLLQNHGLEVIEMHTAASGEEAVFLAQLS